MSSVRGASSSGREERMPSRPGSIVRSRSDGVASTELGTAATPEGRAALRALLSGNGRGSHQSEEPVGLGSEDEDRPEEELEESASEGEQAHLQALEYVQAEDVKEEGYEPRIDDLTGYSLFDDLWEADVEVHRANALRQQLLEAGIPAALGVQLEALLIEEPEQTWEQFINQWKHSLEHQTASLRQRAAEEQARVQEELERERQLLRDHQLAAEAQQHAIDERDRALEALERERERLRKYERFAVVKPDPGMPATRLQRVQRSLSLGPVLPTGTKNLSHFAAPAMRTIAAVSSTTPLGSGVPPAHANLGMQVGAPVTVPSVPAVSGTGMSGHHVSGQGGNSQALSKAAVLSNVARQPMSQRRSRQNAGSLLKAQVAVGLHAQKTHRPGLSYATVPSSVTLATSTGVTASSISQGVAGTAPRTMRVSTNQGLLAPAPSSMPPSMSMPASTILPNRVSTGAPTLANLRNQTGPVVPLTTTGYRFPVPAPSLALSTVPPASGATSTPWTATTPQWMSRPATTGKVAASTPVYAPLGVANPTASSPLHGSRKARSPTGVGVGAYNALRMVAPFQSDSASPEQAVRFWTTFEANTSTLDEPTRLQAFETKLQGTSGLKWWANSMIHDFGTLKARFYSRFIYMSTEQLMEQLRSAKRQRDESIEEWADRVNHLCSKVNFNDLHGRYQYFLDGLRNKRVRSLLDNNVVFSVEDACALLRAKNLFRPVEEPEEFEGEDSKSKRKKNRSEDSKDSLAVQLDTITQQIKGLLQAQSQQQQHHAEQQLELLRQVQHGHSMVASVGELAQEAYAAAVAAEPAPYRGIRQEGDKRTQDGLIVCGRCYQMGHGREECPRRGWVCRRCGLQGHAVSECDVAAPSVNGQPLTQNRNGGLVQNDNTAEATRNGQRNRGRSGNRRNGNGPQCFACQEYGHVVSACPLMEKVRQMTSGQSNAQIPDLPLSAESVNEEHVRGEEEIGGASEERLNDITDEVLRNRPFIPLFTEFELDAIERSEEEFLSEGCDKELEDRLYPLDEEDTRRIIAENEAKTQKPSLKEISERLQVPVEILERNEWVPDSDMDYWLSWFDETLAVAKEAKRANRDFSNVNDDAGAVSASVFSSGENISGTEGGEDSFLETVQKDPCLRLLERRRRVRATVRRVAYQMIVEDLEESRKEDRRFGRTMWDPGRGSKPPLVQRERVRRLLETLPLGERWQADRDLDEILLQLYPYMRAVESCVREKCMRRAARRQAPNEKKTDSVLPGASCYFHVAEIYSGETSAVEGVGTQPDAEEDVSHYVLTVKKQNECITASVSADWAYPMDDKKDDRKTSAQNPKPTGPLSLELVCAVKSGIEALSTCRIALQPVVMLIDTGATVSLLQGSKYDQMRRPGRLEPYKGKLWSSSGHNLRIRGTVRLPVRLGKKKVMSWFCVAENLHVDAIFGTDILSELKAIVDVESQKLRLKETEEEFDIGVPRTEREYLVRLLGHVQIRAGGRALVVCRTDGEVVTGSTVLIEPSSLSPPLLRMARSLNVVHDGRILVEVCNPGVEPIRILEGTIVARATVLPPYFEELGGDTVSNEGANCDSPPNRTPDFESEGLVNSIREIEDREASTPLMVNFEGSKLTAEQQELLRRELESFRDLFVETSKKPGRTDRLKFKIDTGNHPPIKQKAYRVSKAEGDVMEAEIKQYLDLGLIQPSMSPWASPVLMIRKPDGGIRFCIDYRRLNAVTVKDCYPMPLIDDLLDVLGNAKLFSTMDVASGYWNVPMDEDSIEKTAFTCKFGLYEWLVMPFGLSNAVPAFERLMEGVLDGLKWKICLVYLDDVVVYSEDFPTHLLRLRQVLSRLREAGFKLKIKKCHWGRSQVAFLGHIVTPSGLLPNPEKVKAVMKIQRPSDLRSLRAFLGLTSYFRRYIKGYAVIAAPLERLKQKGVAFEWNDDCESAFRQLRLSLVKPPILIYPNFRLRFKLYVDSSRLAVGACLMQHVDGRDRVVAYASKMLVGSQRQWATKDDGISEIECWGIVWATRKFRCYLDKREFDLYTDHQALTWIFGESTRTSNAKLARWAMELSQLQFKVHHRPGTRMGHVDGLSRLRVNAIRIDDLLNPIPELATTSPNGEIPDSRHLNVSDNDRTDPPPGAVNPYSAEVDSLEGDVSDTGGTAGSVPVAPVDIFRLDREQLIEEQKVVPWMAALRAYLGSAALPLDPQRRTSTLKMAPHFVLKDGLLMRRVSIAAGGGHGRDLEVPVIPLPFVETILHHCHKDVFSAHLGRTKTVEKVRRHAYWHGWKKDAEEYVRACDICSGGKGYRPWRNGRMMRMPVADLSGPFALLVVDAVGPLPVTPRGNKYILVFADYFTRWTEAFAVPKLDSVTFVDCLMNEIISRYGVPERLLSDQGPNFVSSLARSFYETIGIKKLTSSSYHPQTQGLVERFNGTLLGMLRMFVNETQDNWDVYLPRVLLAYRTAYHESLGDSPFFSLFGRDPVLPLDLAFLNVGKTWKSNDLARYRRELFISLRKARTLVERQLLKAQDRNARSMEEQVAVKFNIGDPVWVYQFFRKTRRPDDHRSRKLAFSWHGPYRIVDLVGENACRVAVPSHPKREITVNVNRLKPYRGRWSRPFPDESPAEITNPEEGSEVLNLNDLPDSSFVSRRTIEDEDTVFTNVQNPIVEVVAKRSQNSAVEYLVLTANFETFWVPRGDMTEYLGLIQTFEDVERAKKGLPALRRSVRLADANEDGDEGVLF